MPEISTILNPTLEMTNGGTKIGRSALSGDVAAASESNTTALANTAVTPGTYGDGSNVGQFTVDAKGRITLAANVPIAVGSAIIETFGITVGDGTNVITTGMKGFFLIPYAGTILGWCLSGKESGNLEFDILTGAFGAVPASSIVASAPPVLSGAQFNSDTTLTGWTTAVTANLFFAWEVVGSPATVTRATLQLIIQRS